MSSPWFHNGVGYSTSLNLFKSTMIQVNYNHKPTKFHHHFPKNPKTFSHASKKKKEKRTIQKKKSTAFFLFRVFCSPTKTGDFGAPRWDHPPEVWAFGCVVYEMCTLRCAEKKSSSSSCRPGLVERLGKATHRWEFVGFPG